MSTATAIELAQEFNHAVWTPGSQLTMVNVPWNNDYRDIVRFDDQAALDAWIDTRPNVSIANMSMLRFNQNVKINVPFNAALRYNYLRASNPLQPVHGDVQRNYYYFITDVVYLAPNNTQLTVQLDVWQTFGYEVTFGAAYIERGHIGIANQNAFAHYGRQYLAQPEGMDVGGEYRIVNTEHVQVMNPDQVRGFSVLVCSTVDLTKDPGSYGTADNPRLTAAPGANIQGLPSGASFYWFNSGSSFSDFLTAYADKPWIMECIISVTVVPPMGRYFNLEYPFANAAPAGSGVSFYHPPVSSGLPHNARMMPAWRDAQVFKDALGPRYSGLLKFYTYPYMVIELTSWTGSPLVIKPESWQDPDASVRELGSIVPPGQRIAIAPYRYNGASTAPSSAVQLTGSDFTGLDFQDDNAEFLNFAVTISNFPTLPVVNNQAINFLASNRNSLAFAFRSADWSQQRAMLGAGAARTNAGTEITRSAQESGIANRATANASSNTVNNMQANAAIQFGQDALAGATGGDGDIPGLGLLTGVVKGSANMMKVSNNANLVGQQAANTVQARGDSTIASMRASGMIRDTNYALAQSTSQGDYANTVAGVQAKIQDAALTQPSVSGQFGGEMFNFTQGLFAYSLRFKMLPESAMRQIGEYWLRYGYAVGAFVQNLPASMMVMSKFTYWKLTETYITQGAFPEGYKQVLRGIFEKGVTVWARPEYIGNTDWADNTPQDGITY